MSLELWQIISFVLAALLSGLGFMVRQAFNQLKSDVDSLRGEIRSIHVEQSEGREKMYREFVAKEDHHIYIGKMEGLFSTVFRDLKNLTATLNQTIGQLNYAREQKRND